MKDELQYYEELATIAVRLMKNQNENILAKQNGCIDADAETAARLRVESDLGITTDEFFDFINGGDAYRHYVKANTRRVYEVEFSLQLTGKVQVMAQDEDDAEQIVKDNVCLYGLDGFRFYDDTLVYDGSLESNYDSGVEVESVDDMDIYVDDDGNEVTL